MPQIHDEVSERSAGPCLSSSHTSSALSAKETTPASLTLLLYPDVTITAEVSSVSTDSATFWVAIEIAGVLRTMEGLRPPIVSNGLDYGYLWDMRIDIIPNPCCKVCQVVGDLHTYKTLYAMTAHLVVVKVQLHQVARNLGHVRELSDDLMLDLEMDLGRRSMKYLTVRLTYKHSAMIDTRLITEARAHIPRIAAQSAWWPRSSSATVKNPVIALIESYLPALDAQEALRVLSHDHSSIPTASRALTAQGPPLDGDGVSEVDPAHRIWCEMRRTSRSSQRRVPSTIRDGGVPNDHEELVDGDPVQEVREYIRQVALKNKRSVGQDTLKSIAPSLPLGSMTTNSTGLGLGISWPFGWKWT